jgi:transposase, IS30 family
MARGVVLTAVEREEISHGIAAGRTGRVIAHRLGRHYSVVNREIARNGGRCAYRSCQAHAAAAARCGRPKDRKVEGGPRLLDEVNKGLSLEWSPQQMSNGLRIRSDQDEAMRLSHEAVHQALFVQVGGALKVVLKGGLRSGRVCRLDRTQRRAVIAKKQAIPGMVMLGDRPAEAADRAVPGHWEADLIMGAGNASAIVTLVGRTSRFVVLARLPYDRTAERTAYALAAAMGRLPALLKQSLTWDQGREMARHAKFTMATGIPVFFCEPHAPWQRGTNETPPQAGGAPTNGLLRQYFPKGTDLSGYTQNYLDAVAPELNGRPRRTLDRASPTQAINAILLEAGDAPTT